MARTPPAGFVALAVVLTGVGGIVFWVHEGQKRERKVRARCGSSHALQTRASQPHNMHGRIARSIVTHARAVAVADYA